MAKNWSTKLFTILFPIASFLTIVGAINWGFVQWFNFDLVELTGNIASWLPGLVYSLVGISGIWALWKFFKKK